MHQQLDCMQANTFKKSERLCSKILIDKIYSKGNSVVTQFPFRVLWQFTEQTNWEYPAQVLISVSKRNFSLATNRNKVKRLVRELYRLNKHQLYDVLYKNKKQLLLSIHYQGKDILAYHQLEKSFQKMLAKLITQINQHQPTKVE